MDERGSKEHGATRQPEEPQENLAALRYSLNAVDKQLQKVAADMERTQMAEYVALLNRPIKLIWRNFVSGTARGVGIALGFTVFAATILYVLRLLGALNLPIIGDYVADLVRVVQAQLEGKAY
ncbi:DUF5665 domain-containing protein [Paenibacillus sp. MMS18-CY102]|uniref:DUF5665 domain-containing protein n=1 Tax=Paenibacillus sp. MMS18-CY102 TaxID=2682849 RepID=UPI0013657128|nr:DUF5665 domain-containing protein [Paenibacillus sp. MMS18-CY102]MWC27420.1 hypothetical protein [Paenibacillus sp. MMS18-CY102]